MKNTARIFNALITVVCIAAIVLYFVFPILRIEAQYITTADELNKIINENISEGEESIDVKTFIGDTEIPEINLQVTISLMHIFQAVIDSDLKATVATIVDENVESAITQLEPVLNTISVNIVQTYAKQNTIAEIHFQIKEQLGLESDEELKEKLAEVDISEEYIMEKADIIAEAIIAPGATLDTVSDKAIEMAEGIFVELKETGRDEFKDIVFSEDIENEVRKEIYNTLTDERLGIVNPETGEINVENLLDNLLGEYLNIQKDNEDETAFSGVISPLSAQSETQSNLEKLKQQLHDSIMESLPEETVNILYYVFLGLAAYLGFVLFTWVYIILKMLLKIGSKNPAVRLKLPIWMGWSPFLILVLAPVLAMTFIPMEFIPAGLTLSFFSSGIFAAIGAVALIVLWIPYRIIYKNLKNS